jgi:hypothetical protein
MHFTVAGFPCARTRSWRPERWCSLAVTHEPSAGVGQYEASSAAYGRVRLATHLSYLAEAAARLVATAQAPRTGNTRNRIASREPAKPMPGSRDMRPGNQRGLLAAKVLGNERTDPNLGLGAGKSPDDFARDEEQHGRKTAQAIAPGQLHVVTIVDLDRGHAQPARLMRDHALEHRRQRQAGRAPVCPENDEERTRTGGFDDIMFEILESGSENRPGDSVSMDSVHWIAVRGGAPPEWPRGRSFPALRCLITRRQMNFQR